MDVATAFLNGILQEKEAVYMKAPDGAGLPPGTIVKLLRTLYGLKQSPRKRNDRLNEYLLTMGFSRSVNDPALYWRVQEGEGLNFILVYVDDLLIFVPKNSDSLRSIKRALMKEFEMKDLGELKSFLGIQVTRDRSKRTITLSQEGYIDMILERFGFTEANPSWMLMVMQKLEGLAKKDFTKEYNP